MRHALNGGCVIDEWETRMAMTSQPTCAERIGEQLAERLRDFRQIVDTNEPAGDSACAICDAAADDENGGEHDFDAHSDYQYEYPLHVETRRVIHVLISTGGPHDEFNVTVDDDGTPTRIEYVFKDWYDGASRYLDGDEFDTAALFLEPFVEGALQT